MDDGAPLNLQILPPIPLPKTLILVNNFVVNATKFLNRFRCVAGSITRFAFHVCLLERISLRGRWVAALLFERPYRQPASSQH